MNKQEYEKIEEICKIYDLIDGSCLTNKNDRTLLYGYTCDRHTWHVYLKDNQIITVSYYHDEYPYQIPIHVNENYMPNKRLYPERCDFEFCKMLKEKDLHLPFTTWSDNIEEKKYYGKIID